MPRRVNDGKILVLCAEVMHSGVNGDSMRPFFFLLVHHERKFKTCFLVHFRKLLIFLDLMLANDSQLVE